jgi:hypothetical protein
MLILSCGSAVLNKIKKSFNNVKSLLFGQRVNNVQYKTEKTIEREEIPLINEGSFEVDFSATDDNGIIESNAISHSNIVYKQPDVLPEAMKDNGFLQQEEPSEEVVEEIDKPSEEEKQEGYAFFDCPDIMGRVSVTGVRNGEIHLLCTDEMGTTHNIKIINVFFDNGRPRVEGIVIRKPVRDSSNKEIYKPIGYIGFDSYIGFSASSIIAIEDIIKENIKAIRDGTNSLPEEVSRKVA